MNHREDADIRINHIQSRGIILKDDKVLVMFRRKKGQEYYTFPGGHMREGEKPIGTAEREVFEETTIEVENMDIAFEYKNYAKPKKVKQEFYYVGFWKSGEPEISGEESRRMSEDNYYEPMWIPLDELNNLRLLPLMAKEWVDENLHKYLEKRGL